MSTGALEGRVALVTGVSRRAGIAAALARRLLADGARVFATGWTPHDAEMPWGADEGGGAALAQALGAGPGKLFYREADFAGPETPRAVIAETIERFDRIDIVVAAHARSSHQRLAEVSAAELDRCWAANARSSALLGQELLRQRAPGTGGRLILFTSGQHIGPMSDEIAYAISKGAIHQMTRSLADPLADRGVMVNCINPGPTDTGWAQGESHARIAAMFPGGRWGSTENVANLVAWLASDAGAWMTGQVLDSEGGFRRWARADVERG